MTDARIDRDAVIVAAIRVRVNPRRSRHRPLGAAPAPSAATLRTRPLQPLWTANEPV